jgi:hypothetical protein
VEGGLGTCLLNCQKDNVIYVASVESMHGVEHYTGLTGNIFKKHWNKHKGEEMLGTQLVLSSQDLVLISGS